MWRSGKVAKATVIIAALVLTACTGSAPATEKTATDSALKVGFITVGPVNDWGYNYSHELSRRDLEKSLGSAVKTTLVEQVPETEEVERVMDRLIREGNTMLFPTSFGYLDSALRIAAKNPQITVMHCGGFKNAANLGTYFAYLDEPFYLAGMTAGRVSKTGKLGFVAAHPIPNVLREINAFMLGARRTRPNATVSVVWTNSWSDPAKEAEAANSLLDAGADVLGVHQDSPVAVIQTAERRGAYSVGAHADLSQFAPKGWLTGAEWAWSAIVTQSVKSKIDGTWKNTQIRGGLKEGYVKLSRFGDAVPEAVRTEVEAVRAEIVGGTFSVFSGPITDRDGKVRLKAGEAATFETLEQMNWLVDGVKGSVPK